MSEKRYYWSFFDDEVVVFDKKTNQDIICLEFSSDINKEGDFNKLVLIFDELVLRLNEQQAIINRLREKNGALNEFTNDNFNEMMDGVMAINDD